METKRKWAQRLAEHRQRELWPVFTDPHFKKYMTHVSPDPYNRNRSVSPSRIPVAPQAELYRRSSQKALKTTQPATKPATKKTDEKSKKPKSKNGSIVGDRGKSVNPTSLADSGFVSSRAAAAGNRSAEPKSLDSSTKALNQNFSELEARRARRQQQQQRKREPKPMVVHASPPPPSTKRERRPSSSKSVRKSSFGVSATPSVRTSETQTEQQQQQVKPVRRYASMNDVRKSRKTQMVDNSMTTSLTESEDSLTDAETVVHRRPHRRRSQSPKRRSHESLSKPTKIDFVEPPPPPTPINSAAELDVLRGEIMRLKEEMERREQPRPIIKSPVQSDNESKQVKLFSRLKNEVQKLRDEVMKVKSKKSDVDSSSVLDTDSTYQTDVQSTRHSTRNLQHNRQPAHVQPNLQYIPYTEMPSGVLMPMWVLPNKKGMLHAASVPNLTVPLKESRRSQAYRIEPVESDGHTTDVDYRSRKKRPGRFHPVDTVMVYDDELDKKLRKAERAADKVNDRSNRLMRKARHKTYSTAFYGYV